MTNYTHRLDSLLQHYLGESVCTTLADPSTEEIYVNPDMQVRFISAIDGRQTLPETLRSKDVEAFLRALAAATHQSIQEVRPSLAASMTHSQFGRCRVQGFLPPITPGPALVIRKPCRVIPSLADYVASNTLCSRGFLLLQKAIQQRRNIVVAGPTASGKTTLCNAILRAIVEEFPQDRLVILEDTSELRIDTQDCLRLQVTDQASMRRLVRYSLRTTPNRIIVGEVRDGSAKDLLDAWITGHPGGCSTVHGESVQAALTRLADLARSGTTGIDQRDMVLQAIHLVILITGCGSSRIVKEMARPVGFGENGFDIEYLLGNEADMDQPEGSISCIGN